MLSDLIARLSRIFRALVQNRVTEQEIREWLATRNYEARSAIIEDVELHSVQRPGWIQIFRFQTTVTIAPNQRKQLFGAVLSDDRMGRPEVMVFDEISSRDDQLDRWSEGMIVRKSRYRPRRQGN